MSLSDLIAFADRVDLSWSGSEETPTTPMVFSIPATCLPKPSGVLQLPVPFPDESWLVTFNGVAGTSDDGRPVITWSVMDRSADNTIQGHQVTWVGGAFTTFLTPDDGTLSADCGGGRVNRVRMDTDPSQYRQLVIYTGFGPHPMRTRLQSLSFSGRFAINADPPLLAGLVTPGDLCQRSVATLASCRVLLDRRPADDTAVSINATLNPGMPTQQTLSPNSATVPHGSTETTVYLQIPPDAVGTVSVEASLNDTTRTSSIPIESRDHLSFGCRGGSPQLWLIRHVLWPEPVEDPAHSLAQRGVQWPVDTFSHVGNVLAIGRGGRIQVAHEDSLPFFTTSISNTTLVKLLTPNLLLVNHCDGSGAQLIELSADGWSSGAVYEDFVATDGNASGDLVGYRMTPSGPLPARASDGKVGLAEIPVSNGWFTGINSSGIAVGGVFDQGKPTYPCTQAAQDKVAVLQAQQGLALAINDEGVVIGVSYQDGKHTGRVPMAWLPGGKVLNLDPQGVTADCVPAAINDEGIVVGASIFNNDPGLIAPRWSAFMYTDVDGLGDLDRIADVPAGIHLTAALGIDDDCEVVAFADAGGTLYPVLAGRPGKVVLQQ